MLCPSCKFDVPEGSVLCLGCGADLTARANPKRRTKPVRTGGGRRVGAWVARAIVVILLIGLAGIAALSVAVKPEPLAQDVGPEPVVEETPVKSQIKKKAVSPPRMRRQAPISVNEDDDAQLGSVSEWRGQSYGARLSVAANFVTSRATVISTEKLKDAAVYVEGCISKTAAEDATGRQRVAPIAAMCLSEILAR